MDYSSPLILILVLLNIFKISCEENKSQYLNLHNSSLSNIKIYAKNHENSFVNHKNLLSHSQLDISKRDIDSNYEFVGNFLKSMQNIKNIKLLNQSKLFKILKSLTIKDLFDYRLKRI